MHDLVAIESTTPEATRARFLISIEKALLEQRPVDIEVRGTNMSVRGGMFRRVHNWNLLAAVTAATFETSVSGQRVEVRYVLTFTQLVVFIAVCSISFLLFTIVKGGKFYIVGLVFGAMLWVVFYGIRLLTRFRFRWFIRKLLRGARSAEP